MTERLKRLGRLTLDIAWAAVVLLLPITSLPLLSRLMGGAMVAPASVVPLAWLALFWFVFYLINKGSIPRESLPFLFFITIALSASALSFFLNVPSFKGDTVLSEAVSGLLTLGVGAGFYLVTATWLSKFPNRITWTLKLVSIGGAVLLLWALTQAVFIFLFHGKYPGILLQFQETFSTRSLFLTRITGFAFEPSWLAHQLNLTYLPFWLAATVTGWSAFRFRLGRVSLENILLAVGVVVLLLSSRVGMLSLLLVLAFLGVYYNFRLARRVQQWSLRRLPPSSFLRKIAPGVLTIVILLGFFILYISGAIALVYGLSFVDPRLARVFLPSSLASWKALFSNGYKLANYLRFAERYVYWMAGWRIFNLHPLLGVGLGNAGFYFRDLLPSYGWNLPEVMDTFYRVSALPNIKSFWVRLLAETGIAGFASFITWFYVLFRSSWLSRLNKTPLIRMAGWAGLFVLIAFVFEGFSIDTFALPYLWFSLGLVSAAGALARSAASEDAAHTLPGEEKTLP